MLPNSNLAMLLVGPNPFDRLPVIAVVERLNACDRILLAHTHRRTYNLIRTFLQFRDDKELIPQFPVADRLDFLSAIVRSNADHWLCEICHPVNVNWGTQRHVPPPARYRYRFRHVQLALKYTRLSNEVGGSASQWASSPLRMKHHRYRSCLLQPFWSRATLATIPAA
ncbi:hypothetical protein SEUCBS140593_009923 [Sporothrix eucalyptigena]|uniref:Uncharacterized protein n=1 Tax=Sporothrix eucalyptigena TaxID=1812306 RepID=A0ABP0D1G3_9PEZI